MEDLLADAIRKLQLHPVRAHCRPIEAEPAPGHRWNAEVVYELSAICDTMTDIKNLLETLVSRLPDKRRL